MHIKDVVFVYQMRDADERKWHGRFHTHGDRDYEIHYFLQGSGIFLNKRSRDPIEPGSLFFCCPRERHAIIADSGPVTYYAVLFEPERGDREVKRLIEMEIRNKPSLKMGTNFRFFFEELKEKSSGLSSHLHNSAVHQFISFLYLLPTEAGDFHYADEGNIHIERALKIMQENIVKGVTLSDMAARLSLNESYFIRLFKKKMKESPMKYYTKLKVEAAVSMLTHTGMSLQAISEELRYSSVFHFSRVFKKYTGHSPSIYRKTFHEGM